MSPGRVGVVLLVAALCAVGTGLLYADAASSEFKLSEESFKGSFTSSLVFFQQFMITNLRGAVQLCTFSWRATPPCLPPFRAFSC